MNEHSSRFIDFKTTLLGIIQTGSFEFDESDPELVDLLMQYSDDEDVQTFLGMVAAAVKIVRYLASTHDKPYDGRSTMLELLTSAQVIHIPFPLLYPSYNIALIVNPDDAMLGPPPGETVH